MTGEMDRPWQIVAGVLNAVHHQDLDSLARLTVTPQGVALQPHEELAALRDVLVAQLGPDEPPLYEYALTDTPSTYLSSHWARVLLYDITEGDVVTAGVARKAYGAYVVFLDDLNDWRFLKVDTPHLSLDDLPDRKGLLPAAGSL